MCICTYTIHIYYAHLISLVSSPSCQFNSIYLALANDYLCPDIQNEINADKTLIPFCAWTYVHGIKRESLELNTYHDQIHAPQPFHCDL